MKEEEGQVESYKHSERKASESVEDFNRIKVKVTREV